MTNGKPLAEDSWVNRIDGVTLDTAGMIHTQYGAFNPVTGECLPIAAPKQFMRDILEALIRDGMDSGLAEPSDFDEFLKEMLDLRSNNGCARNACYFGGN